MPQWQRCLSHAVLGICAGTGLLWFVLQDLWAWPAPRTTAWWIGHGVSGALALAVLGAAIPQHVCGAWRNRLNLGWGGLGLLALGLAGSSALLLQYGPEPWRVSVRWLHLGTGLVALVAFPCHVIQGRRRCNP